MVNYIKYYDLENYTITDVHANFHRDGHLTAFDFFCIIIWKANRAKSKIAERLLKFNPNLEEVVRDLTNKVFLAVDDKQKLKVLITEYKFRLPMASAILSILYQDIFTVYDTRVCETLNEYKGLDTITNFENLWIGYSDYIKSVREYGPTEISLRDKDRLLWGKSFYEQLTADISNNFEK